MSTQGFAKIACAPFTDEHRDWIKAHTSIAQHPRTRQRTVAVSIPNAVTAYGMDAVAALLLKRFPTLAPYEQHIEGLKARIRPVLRAVHGVQLRASYKRDGQPHRARGTKSLTETRFRTTLGKWMPGLGRRRIHELARELVGCIASEQATVTVLK